MNEHEEILVLLPFFFQNYTFYCTSFPTHRELRPETACWHGNLPQSRRFQDAVAKIPERMSEKARLQGKGLIIFTCDFFGYFWLVLIDVWGFLSIYDHVEIFFNTFQHEMGAGWEKKQSFGDLFTHDPYCLVGFCSKV